MIYTFLAEGFEESEAIIPTDILRRAGFTVKTVGVGGKTVTGSHGIPIVCDITAENADTDSLEAIILPGGMPGTHNLEKDASVQKIIDFSYQNGILICAICAAPSILGHKGLLKGKTATCYSGFEKDLTGADTLQTAVVKDGNFITANGPGAAFKFGFEIVKALTKDGKKTEELKSSMKFE